MTGGIKGQKKFMNFFSKLCMYLFSSNIEIVCMHIFYRIRGSRIKFGFYMRTTKMEDSQGSYSHEEEFIGLHVSMGNVETESNGRRDQERSM
jgi:hypothetical protein